VPYRGWYVTMRPASSCLIAEVVSATQAQLRPTLLNPPELGFVQWDIALNSYSAVTYDHRLRRIGPPVRSALHKPQIGRLVVGWVSTSEYLLLYVFIFF
jgi:hypothetical protein